MSQKLKDFFPDELVKILEQEKRNQDEQENRRN